MTAGNESTAGILNSITPELYQAFADHPAYGQVGLSVFFLNGRISRVEFSRSISKKLPHAEQGDQHS